MTRLLSSPSVATPTQRNRRLLLTLPAAVALPSLITACGGGADLSYITEQALYFVGEAITPNTPQLSTTNPNTNGHKAPTFSVWPPLPAGLTLNAQTGVISGTPTKLRRQSTHTVIATNNRGIAETKIRITVTGRGSWSAGAATQVGRQYACIAPLPEGKVLVAGGFTDDGWTDKAEIYDTATGNWSPTAPMTQLGAQLMSMPLRNGKVLVFGGFDNFGPAAHAELYDPVANAWTVTGSMVGARVAAASCVLPDGKVLVSGGWAGLSGLQLDTIELYDPGASAWAALSIPMLAPREDHAAVVLPGGTSVLLVGARSSPSGSDKAEIYALDGGASKLIASPVTGQDTKAVVLDDGSVLVVTDTAVAWRFYPRTSTWKTSTLSAVHLFAKMVLLADGRVLLAGGVGRNTAEIYNPDVNLWSAAAPMAEVRYAAAATLAANGRVLMVNGTGTNFISKTTELYTP